MALFSGAHHSFITIFSFILLVFLQGVTAATFTFNNKCEYTVWPGILANPGSPKLESTGFELTKGSSRSFQAPAGSDPMQASALTSQWLANLATGDSTGIRPFSLLRLGFAVIISLFLL
ncbi:hypothetical protein V6N13_044876 [Hibiscus sabdariffa]|uniref:Uncharacterized protein n=1 Tax=Hibiscus sabdariffa TaxID=183260 RepID=A0ABR2RJW0_9ROSI